jgi:hypothetical protein
MNRKFLLVPVALACILPFQAQAYVNGRAVGANLTCGGCHGSTSSSAVTVTVAGPTTLVPGAKGTYTTTLTGTKYANGGAGFNVSLSSPATLTAGAVLKTIGVGEQTIKAASGAPAPYGNPFLQLTHVDGGSVNLGVYSYSFELTAPPTAGVIDIRSIMMSYDGDGAESSSDIWNFAPLYEVTVAPAAAVPEASTTLQLGAGLASLAFVGWRRRSTKNS